MDNRQTLAKHEPEKQAEKNLEGIRNNPHGHTLVRPVSKGHAFIREQAIFRYDICSTLSTGKAPLKPDPCDPPGQRENLEGSHFCNATSRPFPIRVWVASVSKDVRAVRIQGQ